MAFLDNSGDIILDAVLTDTGRYRLAKGDGSFKIVKFALGDDEIDYERYNRTHSSGSAYYDLEILQTPVLEAFTNNTSLLKSRLISIPRNNLLYLPVLKVNEVFDRGTEMHTLGTFMIAVDEDTEKKVGKDTNKKHVAGFLYGESLKGGTRIRLDQGLDTEEIPPTFTLDADLVETQYIVEIDHRFGRLATAEQGPFDVSFIDDDNIASYYFSLGTDEIVRDNDETSANVNTQTINGPRGTLIDFKIQSSLELNTSTFLFTELGTTTTMTNNTGGSSNVYVIDTTVRVTGGTTGQRVDVPIRFVKLVPS